MTDLSHRSRGDHQAVRDAVRNGVGFAIAGLVFLFLAEAWIGTCTGSIAQAAGCGVPQRAMLAVGAPIILLAGSAWSLARSLRARREQRAWWAWQGAGWALLALTVLSAVLALPSLPMR